MKKLFIFLAMLLIAQATFNLSAQNLNEGFESETFPPEGWTVINKGDPNGWERTTSNNLINGVSSAYIKYGTSAHNDWLITPRMMPTAENNTISFYAQNYSPVYKDLFHVKLSTTGNAEEDFSVVLAENIEAPTTATKYEYDLSAYNGQIVYVAVQAISTDKLYLSLDDFVGPTIFSPALDAAIVSIENTAAYMGNYDIVVTLKNYGTTDLTACDINYSINGTPSTYNWTGTLAKNAHEQVTIVTDYDFTTPDDYIIEATVVLAGDEGLFNNTRVKTVAYYGLFSFPYFEGFEEGNVNGNAITGWSQQSLSGDESWTANTETTYNRTPRTGNWNAYLRYSNTDWMFTPKRVHLEVGKTYAFAMYARQDYSNGATITVAYGTEPQNSAMVNTIVPSTNITNGNYQEITASFSPAETGVYHLGIKGDIGFSSYLLIDDISIRIVHTLNYAADANGTIAGEAFQIVDPGDNGTAVTAVANAGYHFVQWSDGSTDNPRTDVNVTENMSYTAEFAINTYTITIAAGENGEITPASEQTVAYGSNATFTITPNAGFFIASVLVDNVSVGLLTTYTFNNITDNHTISATFSNVAPTTHAITATAGENGSILPSGVVPVVENGDITFAISATNGYSIKDVLVDGVSVGNVSSYTFANATAAHTIEAEFTPLVNALHFDGTNDYVSFPALLTDIDLSQGFGFAAWVKWDEFTGNARIMSVGNGSGSHSDDIVLRIEGSSKLVAEIIKGDVLAEIRADGVAVNTWHHIALTINPMASSSNSDVTIYVNGVPVKNGTLSTPNNVERNNVWLGKSHWTGDKYFKGSMDEVSFWNKSLTKNDILNSMKTDIIGTETELFGYYKFNQGIKGGNNISEISLSDASTYNRNGELNNFALTGTTSNWVDGYDHSTQTLTVATVANGTLSAIPSEGIVTGSEIAITAIPDLGCTLTEGSIRAYKTGSSSTVVRINADAEGNKIIIMPAFGVTLTAEFTINTYTLNYTAGANGSLTGDATQTVNHGADGTSVTAVANTGYHFAQWSDGVTANPRTDVNITGDMAIEAQFEGLSQVLTIATVENGVLSATPSEGIVTGSEITITTTPANGYNLTQGSVRAYKTDDNSIVVTINVDDEGNRTFIMPAYGVTLTAAFEINSYILTYTAGANGSLTGDATQTVNHGADGTSVTAVANTGYHFVKWSDDVIANPRTDVNVTADVTVEAQFAINSYTLTYTVGANGTLTGDATQTVNHGSAGTGVTAVANDGYYFVQWSDGETANPRTDENVTAEVTVEAQFTINTYDLTYTAGANGSLTGDATQTVNHGADGTAVTAVADMNYHFVQWSDGVTANPRTDENVTAEVTVEAQFAINSYTLTYTAGANGTLVGEATQTVNHGADGTSVTAVANAGYHFVQWSDGITANPRTDVNVTADVSVTAEFAINTYTIAATAGENGTISPSGEQTVEHGSTLQFTFTPDANFYVASVLVDGVSVGVSSTYTFSNISANHTISVTFSETEPTTHAITASAGENGTISPNGEVSVVENDDVSFTVSANQGFTINDVLVDGVSVGNVSTYTFNNVTANHTIEASFLIKSYTLAYTAGVNGSLEGEAIQTVNHGADGVAVTAVPNDGYLFVKWSDGVTANPRIDENVTAEVTVEAEFESSTSVNDAPIHVLSLYPNPAKERVYINGFTKPVWVEVYSLIGEKVIALLLDVDQPLELNGIKNGVYLVRVEGQTFKLVVNN